jgi:uncharacterized protein GlcG (DUF336 family)
MNQITLKKAEEIIDAIFARATELKLKPMAAIVTDVGASTIAFKKQDDSSMLRYEMAHGKCYAALALGRSSSLVRYRAEERPLFMDYLLKVSDGRMFCENGAMLIRNEDGMLLGAVGVTGERPEKDEELAEHGIHTAGFLTDNDAAAKTDRKIRLEN